jgi:homoserine O-acetyltransferase/O-succinyltransferase
MLRRDLLASGVALGATAIRAGEALAQGAPSGPPSPPTTEGIIEKKVFELGNYATRGGETIANVRVGYQSMGQLNAEGTNAVLICHFFSGDSHAFGRYEANGPAGYWDAIIGPDKAIDTNKYFVISSDSLVNVNVPNPRTVTTGPASINPSTGRPYGMDFPVVSIRDFVEVQKKLLDSLGVKRLAMVAGPSNGAMQTVEWAAAYPDFIERCMPVIGGAEFDAWMIGWLDIWESPIRLDPNWRNGDYYGLGREPPLRGLAEAWRIVTLQALDRASLVSQGRKAAEGQDPAHKIGDRFAIEKFLDERGMARARTSDANSFIYMVRANQLHLNEYPSYEAALANAPRRWLVIPSPNDRVFLPEAMREMVEVLRKAGKAVQTTEVGGPLGHLNGVVGMAPLAEQIRGFLNS